MKEKLLILLTLLMFSTVFAQFPPPGCQTTTWDGTVWSPFVPQLTGVDSLGLVIINEDYDTSANFGSFSSCQLTVKNGFTLTISGFDYVEVVGDVGVTLEGTGALIVGPDAGLIQVDDLSSFVGDNATLQKINSTGSSTHVTYWSSPVVGKTVDESFGDDSYGGYRYTFNTTNFEDSYYESNNNNTLVYGPGIDGIDDNGDAWTFALPTTILEPGIGLATRQAPGSPSGNYPYDFNGQFNNGLINVPITRNDDDITNTDENPIFTGNPYPSTISVDTFFVMNVFNSVTLPNGILDARINIWMHSTPPSGGANGNQALNFNANDYATINLLGEIAGNSGVRPDRYISSGQGFFTSYSSNILVPQNGNLVFSNLMRVPDHAILRASERTSAIERLWLNLSTPEGINGEILLGYTDVTTDDDDGLGYDSRTRNHQGQYAMFYFNSETADHKYNIEGKALSSLNNDETVSVGFYNSIEESTEFTISVADVQGNYLSDRTIFLTDNLLGICHNLSSENYTFTSDVGEFNDRFEIRFQNCEFTAACEDLFNIIEAGLEPKNNCGKYELKVKSRYLSDNIVDLIVDGNPAIEFDGNEHFYFTENGIHTIEVVIYDLQTNELCYSDIMEINVDCHTKTLDNLIEASELTELEIFSNSIILYPNPTSKEFNVIVTDKSIIEFKITVRNMFGRVIKHTNNQNNLDVSTLQKGIYFVEISDAQGNVAQKKLIVE